MSNTHLIKIYRTPTNDVIWLRANQPAPEGSELLHEHQTQRGSDSTGYAISLGINFINLLIEKMKFSRSEAISVTSTINKQVIDAKQIGGDHWGNYAGQAASVL